MWRHLQHTSRQTLVFIGIIVIAFIYYAVTSVLGGTTIGLTLNNNPDLERGLVGHWTFDGTDVATSGVRDRSGNGNHGWFLGGATSSALVPGKLGQAVALDGSDDYVSIVQDGSITTNLSNISLAFWVKTTGNNDNKGLLGCVAGENSSAEGFILMDDNGVENGNPIFLTDIQIGGDTGNVHTASTSAPTGSWIHFVYTYSGSNEILYLNGVAKNISAQTGSLHTNTECGLYIGRKNSLGSYADASLDDVRLYNRALSSEEVRRLYELGATTKINTAINTNPDLSQGLLGHWTFDGTDITSAGVLDRSGNGNHGWFMGGATTSALVPGKIGQGMVFDGDDDTISLSDIFPDVGTVSAWVKPAFGLAVSTQRHYMGTLPSGNLVRVGANTFGGFDNYVFEYRGSFGSTCQLTAEPAFTSDTDWQQWRHVVITWNVSSGSIMYLNGAENNTLTCTTGSIDSTGLSIGSRNGAEFWQGMIDDVRLYNRELSPEEVERLYGQGGGVRIVN